jgi:hemin uptake protein HemP
MIRIRTARPLQTDSPRAAPTSRTPVAPDRVASADLLAGRRQLEIEHAGRIYRLCLTANNKLILVA